MGHGVGPVVGKGEKNILNAEGLANLLCFSIKGEEGFSHEIVLHFDIGPLNTVSEPHPMALRKASLAANRAAKHS